MPFQKHEWNEGCMPGKHSQRELPQDQRAIPENVSKEKHAECKAISTVLAPV